MIARATIGHYFPPTESIKRWEAEWGGKVVASHGTTHSKGIMVLFKLNLNVTINKTLADKNARYILAEISIDETNIVFVNIYAHSKLAQYRFHLEQPVDEDAKQT